MTGEGRVGQLGELLEQTPVGRIVRKTLTVEEAAALAGVDKESLYDEAAAGGTCMSIPIIRYGRRSSSRGRRSSGCWRARSGSLRAPARPRRCARRARPEGMIGKSPHARGNRTLSTARSGPSTPRRRTPRRTSSEAPTGAGDWTPRADDRGRGRTGAVPWTPVRDIRKRQPPSGLLGESCGNVESERRGDDGHGGGSARRRARCVPVEALPADRLLLAVQGSGDPRPERRGGAGAGLPGRAGHSGVR